MIFVIKKNLNVSELKKQLEIINNGERYSDKIAILISALGAFFFVFLFGGKLPEAIAAFFIGFIIKSLSIKFYTLEINQFFINSICAGITAILAILFLKMNLINDIDKTIIGSIMLLVPGLAIEEGHIKVDRLMKTNIPGCFAAGDCVGKPYQYIKSAGEGNIASLSAVKYLDELSKK